MAERKESICSQRPVAVQARWPLAGIVHWPKRPSDPMADLPADGDPYLGAVQLVCQIEKAAPGLLLSIQDEDMPKHAHNISAGGSGFVSAAQGSFSRVWPAQPDACPGLPIAADEPGAPAVQRCPKA
jgi:hypothetical protein